MHSSTFGESEPPRRRLGLFWKLLLGFGGLVFAMVLLIVLAIAMEHWRGQRAWAACQREMEARGEKLDLIAFVPPPVPDDQNFAATPFFESLPFEHGGGNAGDPWPDVFSKAEKQVEKTTSKAGKKGGPDRRLTDLVAWQKAFRKAQADDSDAVASEKPKDRAAAAAEVLEALKACDPLIGELQAAAKRPQARFPINYEQANPAAIPLPHLARLKRATVVLRLRACAELAAGKNNAALEDVKLMLRLADSMKEEPFLISQLVRMACQHIAVTTIWEGLAERTWSASDVAALQAAVRQVDMLASSQRALRGERAFGLGCIEYLRTAPRKELAQIDPASDMLGNGVAHLRMVIPEGWFLHEKASFVRSFQDYLAPDSDIERRRLEPRNLAEQQRQFEHSRSQPWKVILNHQLFSRLLLPALGKSYAKFAAAQTALDQAAIACALERYRQAHQKFPEKLEALVPAFIDKLPVDLFSGDLMGYRTTSDGQFTLWSIGWNAMDDGGVPGRAQWDDENGDWVWEYPAK